jgi:carbonic anhydrase/acetyltransferase-like protein (isoleucine patch superfamily)
MALLEFNGKRPRLGKDVYVDPTSRIVGDVELCDDAAVWFCCLLKGEIRATRIGRSSVIMEYCFIEDAQVGEEALVSHRAILHKCVIGRRVLVGIGAVILDDAQIREGSIVGAGSVVPAGAKIPEGCVVLGSPAKVCREVTEKDRELFNKVFEEARWKTSIYKRILSGSNNL